MAIDRFQIEETLTAQQGFFLAGNTRSLKSRKKALLALHSSIKKFEEDIIKALKLDLHKPHFEAYSSELGFVLQEIGHTLYNLHLWMEPQRVSTPLTMAPASSHILPQPLGQVLILGPWNYPFNLVMAPLIAALAAGNTAVLKLPWQTPKTAKVINEIISEAFEPNLVVCIDIEDEYIIPELIEQSFFQHIFFTGSKRIGKLIYKAAAENLIPVTLELGGKSPAIVDASADLKVAAKRIIWGKCFNAGQTCIAPDHVLVQKAVAKDFKALCAEESASFMSAYADGEGLGHIVNKDRFAALESLLIGQKVLFNGEKKPEELFMGLHLIDEPGMDSSLMKEEIFGPILPFISWADEDDLLQKISQNPDPLALYLFTKDMAFEKRIKESVPFGGGVLNDCLVHFANAELPFGGIGSSGLGSYHSKKGFDTFSHYKAWVRNTTWIDIPARYAPYSSWKNKLIKFLMK